MVAIEVEYLLGRAVATDVSRRDFVEWPPHPTRLFSALVDALGDMANEPRQADGEAALRWLETLPPPAMRVSIAEDIDCPRVVKYFVPVNDEVANADNMRPTPLTELRTRQERFFPRAVPADPRVVYWWRGAEPSAEIARGLAELTARVSYLGHSSSLVRVCCTQREEPPNLAPSEDGEFILRVPGPGRLDRLNAVYEARKTNSLAQPPIGRTVRYGIVQLAVVHGPHGDVRVVAFDRAAFGLPDTALVTSRFRNALLSKLPDGKACPESLSGHAPDGKPATTSSHIAFVPLANVSCRPGEHSDGSLKGIAVLLPRDLSDEARSLLDGGLARLNELLFGARGRIQIHVVDADARRDERSHLRALDPSRYRAVSRTWSTVTPVALGRHSKPKKRLTEEAILAEHLREIGLPEPEQIVVHRTSAIWGASVADEYSHHGVKSLVGRVLRHVSVRFFEPVRGPLVIGAARHMGFGLLIPREA